MCVFIASRSGSIGVVHLIETDDDITWIEMALLVHILQSFPSQCLIDIHTHTCAITKYK